ncbi:MAG: hypothetical protein ABSB99_09160 [Acidimicrobiales bacterium]
MSQKHAVGRLAHGRRPPSNQVSFVDPESSVLIDGPNVLQDASVRLRIAVVASVPRRICVRLDDLRRHS